MQDHAIAQFAGRARLLILLLALATTLQIVVAGAVMLALSIEQRPADYTVGSKAEKPWTKALETPSAFEGLRDEAKRALLLHCSQLDNDLSVERALTARCIGVSRDAKITVLVVAILTVILNLICGYLLAVRPGRATTSFSGRGDL